MTYTQADADAAKAKIAADTAALATQTQAVTDAQTALASAQAAETMAGTQLTAAQDALASAQGAATDAASKLDAANAAVSATKADIATQQAIIDAFNAQPAPPPPPPPPSSQGPLIVIAPPVTSNPAKVPGSTIQLGTSGKSYVFDNRVSDPADTTPLGLLYKTVGGAGTHIPLIKITNHDLVGNAGLIRIQYEEVDELIIDSCRLLKGAYDPGVICGMLHIGHGIVHKATVRNITYQRAQPITSPGDIYAGLATVGGHDKAGVAYGSMTNFLFENCDISECWTAYADPTKYPNSDGDVMENLSHDGVYRNCRFTNGADAGLDRKSPNTVADNCIFTNWRESQKHWCNFNDGPTWSNNPRHAHDVITPQPSVGRLQGHSPFRSFAGTNPKIPLFDVQRAGCNLVYDAVDLSRLPPGQVLATAEATAYGSTINLGGKTYTINHGTVML